MIKIEQGLNEIILTLTEMMDDINNNIIIKLEKEQKVIIFSSPFEQTNERYDTLTWTINSGDTNLTGGTINIQAGLWDYTIAETSDPIISESMLNETYFNSLNVIERGKLRLELSDISTTTYTRNIEKTIYNR